MEEGGFGGSGGWGPCIMTPSKSILGPGLGNACKRYQPNLPQEGGGGGRGWGGKMYQDTLTSWVHAAVGVRHTF